MNQNDIQNEEIILPEKIKQYSFRGCIGKGSFSSVFLIHNDENDEYFACKVIQKTVVTKLDVEYLIRNELLVWKELSHPFIVNLIDYFQDDNNLYYIMEYCPNGDLFVMLSNTGPLREPHASRLTKMILEAISYMHSLNIAHRDLKPENILFDKFGNIKIADFGLSTKVDSPMVSNFCGSMGYISPECFISSFYDPKKCDLWALGVIVYSMVTNMIPWEVKDTKKLFKTMESENYMLPSFLSTNCQSFISSLLKADPHKRMTIDECFQHPWIAGFGFPCIRKSNSKTIFSPSSNLKKPKFRIDKSSIFAHVSPKKNPAFRIRKRNMHEIDNNNWALNFNLDDENVEEKKDSQLRCTKDLKEIKKTIFFPPIKT